MGARVLIADDHATVRVGLRARLEASQYQVVAEARSADDAMQILATTGVDAFITDLAMPNATDGLDYLATVASAYPHLPVIVLTMLRRPAIVQAVYRLGIAGLVDKADSLDHVMHALRRVLAGERYISASLKELLGAIDSSGALIQSALSPRERDILRLMREGEPLARIARALGTSPTTVSMQKASLMRKLGLRNNADLFDYLSRQDGSGMPS
jgi:two-component system capsular synthesis response regulator RcsB